MRGFVVRRARSRFRTSRIAWRDIERRTGLRPGLVRPSHTREVWRWFLLRKNTGSASVSRAMRLYKRFHRAHPREGKTVEVATVPDVTVQLGELVQVNYRRREGGKVQEFFHRFKKPRPILASDPNGKALFVIGGGYKIKDIGIVG